jgi:oligopeptide/dipeptide ABC transporter ATP-binding protein
MNLGLLQVESLRVEVRSRWGTAFPVDGVTLSVSPGECLGVVGESGVGKSLTLRAIVGRLPAGVGLASGSVTLDGLPYTRTAAPDARIGMIFQEPKVALNPLMRVGDLIAEGLRGRGFRGKEARAEVIALMDEVGIADARRRLRSWPHELSGGQRQRVAIAMALAAEPAVLLCDEPTTALDTTVQQRILELLDRLRDKRELAIVFVSHSLAVIERISHRVAVMYAGRIVEQGPTDEVLARPRHPYTARLLANLPPLEYARALPGLRGEPPDSRAYPAGCRFHPRCDYVTDECFAAAYTLRASGGLRQSSCVRSSQIEPLLAQELA